MPDPRRWRILGVSLVIAFMALLDVTIVNVALPSIQSGLGTTPATVQWVVSGYALAFGLTLVAGGRLGDAYGRRRLMLIGLAGFVVASAAVGLAPTAELVIVARLVQGASAGLLTPQNSGLVQQLFRGEERGRAFGMFGLTVGISSATGPVLGGLIIALAGEENGLALAVPGQHPDRPGRDGGDPAAGAAPRPPRPRGARAGSTWSARCCSAARCWPCCSRWSASRAGLSPRDVRAARRAGARWSRSCAGRHRLVARGRQPLLDVSLLRAGAGLRQRAGGRRDLLHRVHRDLPGALGATCSRPSTHPAAGRAAADPVRARRRGDRAAGRAPGLADPPPDHRHRARG